MTNVFVIFPGWTHRDVAEMKITEFAKWHGKAIEIDKMRGGGQ